MEVRSEQKMQTLISLQNPKAMDPSVTGGKASVLARLRRAGFPVADGVVITASAIRQFMNEHGWVERWATVDCKEVECSNFDASLLTELRNLLISWGERFVVRSSGVEEDGADSSWAGQFESVVGVGPGDALERAIMACIASIFNERVRNYRNAGSRTAPEIAVLIQPLIEPICAGVMFTINPLTGSWREMTVEAAWGQAAPVVQGEVVPDFHVVRRPRQSPRVIRRAMAHVQLEVVEDVVRTQDTQWVAGPNGLDVVKVDAARQDAPKLRHQQLLQLCRLGLRIESCLGAPQDVEWALRADGTFAVLQARPITTGRSVRRVGPTLWSRRFIGERWTEPATPLGWSMMRGLLDEFIGYPQTASKFLGGDASMQMVRFAPYMNVSVFRHLAFKLPGAPPPQFMMELLPTEEQRAWRRRHAQSPDLGVYAAILLESFRGARWRRFSPGLWSNPREWDDVLDAFDEQLPLLSVIGRTVEDALDRSDRCEELARRYIGVHVCSLLWANVLHQISSAALSAFGKASLVKDALRPVEESWTVKTNHALWKLGRGHIKMDAFLKHFGHRASSSWELFSPRWGESEGAVWLLAEAASQHDDPHRLAMEQGARARSVQQSLSGWLGRLVAHTQVYLALRENQRFHFDRLLYVWGNQLKRVEELTGIPVRYLQYDELRRMASGELSESAATELAAKRRTAWLAEVERRANGDEPPNFLVGAEALAEEVQGVRMQGVGVSPGVVTGRVRILRSPTEAGRLQTGEILVARATDPGWTPLFMKAGGLVMELGGMLSHGAVVAREYELPAIVNIPGVTGALRDGQTVTLDGSQGAVWLIPEIDPVDA